MNQDYLLPTNDIREIKDLYLEPIDLINNGQCTAYYAVVIYTEDEIIYIENKKIAFPDRLFQLILHVAKAGKKGIKGQEMANKMNLDYSDVYQYKDRVNLHKKYKKIFDKDLIVLDEKGYWRLNVNYGNHGLLII